MDAETILRIIEVDWPTVEVEILASEARLIVITNVRLEPDRLILYDFHVDGPGPGTLGVHRLREIGRQVMETMNVAALEIHGFRRTTGASPGHVPRPIRFSRR